MDTGHLLPMLFVLTFTAKGRVIASICDEYPKHFVHCQFLSEIFVIFSRRDAAGQAVRPHLYSVIAYFSSFSIFCFKYRHKSPQ